MDHVPGQTEVAFRHVDMDERAAGQYMRRKLDLRWSDVVAAHEFTRQEEEKLLMAGCIDIERFLDHLKERWEAYVAWGAPNHPAWVTEFRSIYHQFRRGPLGEGSLFSKVLGKIEDDKERARPASGAGVR